MLHHSLADLDRRHLATVLVLQFGDHPLGQRFDLLGTDGPLLTRLLAVTRVAIISGGALAQFLKQVVATLPIDADLSHLYLLPTSGAALYEFISDDWKKIYEVRLSEKDKEQAQKLFEALDENDAVNDIYSNVKN